MTDKEALTLALEALEEPKEHFAKHRRLDAITAIKEALAQPEQEPVTWRYKIVDVFGRPAWTLKTPKSDTRVLESQPLYTTPPQRTWIGLTDEEIAQGCKESWVTEQAWQSAVWWAEAKLKEKNT